MSQDEVQKVQVRGKTYKIYMLEPYESADLWLELLSAFGPALAPLAENVFGDKALMDAAKNQNLKDFLGQEDKTASGWGGSLERGAQALFSNFTPVFQRKIFEKMAAVSFYIDGDKEVKLERIITMHFRGHIFDMYEWAYRALEVQYSDFFERARLVIGSAVNQTNLAA